MWATEHSVETSAAPKEIWRLWADVAGWPDWNGDIERIELVGPFATGGRIVMTPIGQEPIELRIAEAVEARAVRRRGRVGRDRGADDPPRRASRP
jgi:hypothetical protein